MRIGAGEHRVSRQHDARLSRSVAQGGSSIVRCDTTRNLANTRKLDIYDLRAMRITVASRQHVAYDPRLGCPERAGTPYPLLSVSPCAIDPRPGQEAIGTYYEDSYGAFRGRSRRPRAQKVWELMRDAAAGLPLSPGYRPVRALIRATGRHRFDINVPLDDGAGQRRVIDIGCGYGDILIYLKSRGCVVFGVDLDERAAKMASSYGVDVCVSEPDQIPVADGSFTTAIMCHSLEHVPDPVGVLKEVHRVLAPDGELFIAVPNGASAGLRRQGRRFGHLSFPLHFWFYDKVTIGELLTRSGFRLTRVRYRMTWGSHRVALRELRLTAGVCPAAWEALSLIAEVLARPSRCDVLKVEAKRSEVLK